MAMIVHGINKLTLLDYPEHTACTLFVGGCNFRCPFCQNGSLVLHPQTEPRIPEEWLFSFLAKRRGLLQGVCITGGEPTLQPDLDAFVGRIRALGYQVKLDTNGYRSDVLERLLNAGLLDAVAMDVKSSPEHYAQAAGLSAGEFDFSRIARSAELLERYAGAHPDFAYEFRTTLVRGLQTREDLIAIGKWLADAPRYYLQTYEDSEGVIDRTMKAFTREEAAAALVDLRAYIPHAELRG